MKPDRIEVLLRQQPPDEPAYVPNDGPSPVALDPVAPRGRAAGGVPGRWAVAVGALIVAVFGWQSLVAPHGPAASGEVPTAPASPIASESTLPPGVIPWLDTAYAPATPEPTAPVESLPLCQADDLVLLAGGWGGATGSMGGGATLINTWANPCRIEKLRDAYLLDAQGRHVADATFLVSLNNSPANRVGLAAGGLAAAVVIWSNWCGGSIPRPLTLSITLSLDTVNGPQDTALAAPVQPYDPESSGEAPRCDSPGGSSTISVGPFQPVVGETSSSSPAACRASDLLAFAGGGGAAAGTYYTAVVIYNGSSADCVLPTEPSIELRDAKDRVVVTAQSSSTQPATIDIPAQTTARAQLGLSDWCISQPALPLAADVVLGDGRLDIAPSKSGSSFGPGGCMSAPATPPPNFIVEEPFARPDAAPEPAPPDPGDSLPIDVVVSLPATVLPGQTLEYTVTLTNHSPYDKPINLAADCPSFVERLAPPSGGPPIESRHVLNCAPAGVVAGGASRTFEMRLPIPADAGQGPATLVWQLGFAGTGDKVSFDIGG